MKDPTLLLTYRKTHDNHSATGFKESWTVEKVTDSLMYSPGEILCKSEVKDLCEIAQWKVTIIGPK